jgi:hypothetical protein
MWFTIVSVFDHITLIIKTVKVFLKYLSVKPIF